MVKSLNEIAAEMQSEFPKASKQTISIALRTMETGVKFCPRAQEIYSEAIGRKKHSQKRNKVFRFQYRLTEDVAAAVRQAMNEDGIASVQTWHEMLILDYLKKRKAASTANADSFPKTNDQ
jgi:hypothetical protein